MTAENDRLTQILGQVMGKLELLVKDLTNLNIVTALGEVTVRTKPAAKPGDPDRWQVNEVADGTPAIVTRIDLADGDITHLIHTDFAGDDGAWLREVHGQMEEKGRAVLRQNVATLKDLAEWIRGGGG